MSDKYWPLWSKTDCHACGEKFYVSRAQDRPKISGERLLCGDCESYESGYDEAQEELKKAQELAVEIYETLCCATKLDFQDAEWYNTIKKYQLNKSDK